MPTRSIFLTPSRAKKKGMTSMKKNSDIWPRVMVAVMFLMPPAVRYDAAKP